MISCQSNKQANEQKQHVKDASNPYTTCRLIQKSFINKGGKVTEYSEFYLQCSIQDYFIKICESKVDKSELEKYLNKGITVDMEIKEGMWDHCEPNVAHVQSRVGTYVVIKKIINE